MASINASTSGAGGVITTADATGTLQLQSASTTVATINAYGIGLGTGVPSSGIGITFPATQSASSDANTLDDYEEGTWTPQLTFGGVSTGMVNSVAVGSYTKIGRVVHVAFNFSYSTKGSATGAAQLAGLPFAAAGSSVFQGYSVGVFAWESNGATTCIVSPFCLAWQDSTLYLRANNGTATSYTSIQNTNFGTTSEIWGSIVYRTAS